MTTDIIKFGFVAGEISDTFYGRSDLEKFDLALAEAENWFVDYRGGISTRPGQEFIDYVKTDTLPVKFFSFKFSSDIEDTYAILAGHLYFRFIQDGAYVLETGQDVTSVSTGNPAVLGKVAHGYSNGDWIKLYNVTGMTELEGQTFVVTNVAADTFDLYLPTGQTFNAAGLSAFTAGTMARVYTLVTPYTASNLELLQWDQRRDLVRLTHPDFKIRNLERVSHASWTITEEDLSSPVDRVPTSGLSATSSDASSNWYACYVITAVDREGNESFTSEYEFVKSTNPLDATNPSAIRVRWNPVDDIDYYNVYRSNFFFLPSSIMSRSGQVGYIGRAFGTHFNDNGIIPDFSKSPPRDFNPFADGAIENITVTAGGSGYGNGDDFTITDPDGTGFVGFTIVELPVNASVGPVAGILIVERGSGYTAPVAVIGGGTGATFEISVTPLTGNNPRCATVFQQRQVYAATDNKPLTLFGSRPGRLSNFTESDVVTEGDPYEHEIDADAVSPIRHIIPAQGGLLIFNQDAIWLLNSATGVITPLNANADFKAQGGSTLLKPLKVDADLLYVESKGNTVRMLSYNDVEQTAYYAGRDVSILANHLISKAAELTSWGYAPDLFKQVIGTREDGVALAFTVLKEQEIYAWSRYVTAGEYKNVIAIQEGRVDSFYFIVEREINGRTTKFIERQVQRDFDSLEESFCVDCGLTATFASPETVLIGLYHLEGEEVAILADGNVVSGLVVENGSVTLPFAATVVTVGLAYTCKLKSLRLTVPNNIVEHRRKRITGVALRVKETRGLKLGGYSYDKIRPMKERTTEAYNEPTRLQEGVKVMPVDPHFEEDVQLHIIQSDPLPATLLGWVLETEIGDDPD